VVPQHEYHANTDRPQTAKKLSILRKYLGVWLTIWSGEKCLGWVDKRWYVLDLFAGTGESHGAGGGAISGSPLVILEEIEAKATRLRDNGICITLILREQHSPSCEALEGRVDAYLDLHPKLADVVDVDVRCEDCNIAVAQFASSVKVTLRTPAFVFVDPFGLAIRMASMDALMSLPWAIDVLFNYMLDGIRRVFGAASGDSVWAEPNATTLQEYFGEDVTISEMEVIEDPRTYAAAAFGRHGLRTVAFFMRWPTKEAIQYILLFACRNSTVVDIMRSIYAKEMTDRYGQRTLFDTEELLTQIEVIEP
jgi:three-Cys-motif partner protein